MGMIGNLSRISDDTRISLLKDPEQINTLLYPEFDEAPQSKPGFLSRIFGKKDIHVLPTSRPPEALPEEDTMDLDKTWHALHFLFTGSDWEGNFPNGFLVSCGEPIGDVDVGYGPAKVFTPQQVDEIAAFLGSVDQIGLKQRFDPKKMHEMEIYPSIWDNEADPEQELEYVLGGLEELQGFIRETVDRKMALLVYIN
jgi:hypothetical protein